MPEPLLNRKLPVWLLLTVRLGIPLITVDVTLLALLRVLASPGVVTLAWFVTGAPPFVPLGLTVIEKVALPPAGMGPGTVQVTVGAAKVQVAPLAVIKEKTALRVSVTVIAPVVGPLPMLLTV